jgi:hypothetical protein
MDIRSPAHVKLESAIEARLAAGKVLLPAHVTHAKQCMSCAQFFDGLAELAGQPLPTPAGLNKRVLRAVIADQQPIHSQADQRETVGLATFGITLSAAAVVLLLVTTSNTWLAAIHLYWQTSLGV